MLQFCAVYRHKGKEYARSPALPFERACAKARAHNASKALGLTWNSDRDCAYVEEAPSVKHLPIQE